MATQQTAIDASTSASTEVVPANAQRRELIIQNYGNATFFVAFGQAATAGQAGELMIGPGQAFAWSETLAAPVGLPDCPLESINVIASSITIGGVSVTSGIVGSVMTG